jgi:hypothetical protein
LNPVTIWLQSSPFRFRKSLINISLSCAAAFAVTPPARAQGPISNVDIYKQTATGTAPPAFIVEIRGANLDPSGDQARLLVFPSEGTTVTLLDHSATIIRASISAPANYAPSEISLSYSSATLSKALAKTGCTDADVVREFFYVPPSQANEKYGTGVGKNFDVIQVSIVNKCDLPVLIPLAGINVTVDEAVPVYPFSLDHVTSIFSYDRQFSGRRAVYFNILQGMATVGSAVEPFFARGFTQGVSILGGGFTQASLAVWRDMTAEQLQNLASQSYQSTEQVGPNGGSLQKFLFLPKKKQKAKDEKSFGENFANGDVKIQMQIVPVITPTHQ